MRRPDVVITPAITLALALAAGTADEAAGQGSDDEIDLATWRQADLYDGWTAQQFSDATVYGEQGRPIGEIENLIVGADGKLEQIIVETGGLLDIGDTHIAVPWSEVDLGPDLEWINVPVSDENVEEFSLFDEGEGEVETGERAWRATELINDYVSLEDNRRYGMVQDLIFSEDGEVEAILVYPDVTFGEGGPAPYPFYGYDDGFDPGSDTYELPYTADEIQKLGPFDMSRFETGLPEPPNVPALLEDDSQG